MLESSAVKIIAIACTWGSWRVATTNAPSAEAAACRPASTQIRATQTLSSPAWRPPRSAVCRGWSTPPRWTAQPPRV